MRSLGRRLRQWRQQPAGRGRIATLVALVWLSAGAAARAEEPRSLAFSAGVFDAGASEVLEGGVELRFPVDRWKMAAVGGFYRTAQGGYYGFGGLRRDFSLGELWRLTPTLGVALYDPFDGIELGGPLEFRSAIELGRLIGRDRRVALAVYHLSNAALYNLNPGQNSVILTYSFAVGGRR